MDIYNDKNDSYLVRIEKQRLRSEVQFKKNYENHNAHIDYSAGASGQPRITRRTPAYLQGLQHSGRHHDTGKPINSQDAYYLSAGYNPMTEEEVLRLQKQDRLDSIRIRESQKKYFTNKLTKLLKSYICNDKLKTYLKTAKPKQINVIKSLVIANFPHPSNTECEKDTSKKEIDILYDKIKHAVDNDNINSVFKRLINKSPRYYYSEWETALKKVKRHHRLQKIGGLPLITLTGSTLVGIFTGMASVPDSRSTNQAVREGGYIAHDVVDAPNGLLIRNSPVSREGNIVGKLSNGECIYVRGAVTGEWAEISRSPRSEQTKTYVSKNYLRRNATGICP